MAAFKCPDCGGTNRIGAKFCRSCGKAFPVLAERYIVGQRIKQDGTISTYEAVDTWRCQCGALLPSPESSVCQECGAEPVQPFLCSIRKYPTPPHPSQTYDDVEVWLYDERENAWYGSLRPQWQKDWFLYGQRLAVGLASHPGQRSSNEDAVLVQLLSRFWGGSVDTIGLLAVADGMGGLDAGDVASRTATQELLLAVYPFLFAKTPPDRDRVRQEFEKAILAANEQVIKIRKQMPPGSDTGTTLTAAIVIKGAAVIANVGDSRTYLFRDGKLKQITHDHSLVYRLFQAGQITLDEIYTHPRRSEIYRCLGEDSSLEIDTFEIGLEPGDRLLLCCDGLWEFVHDGEMAQILQETPDPQVACDELIRRANLSHGDDNISVIIADVQALTEPE